jgi:hypothetical protein
MSATNLGGSVLLTAIGVDRTGYRDITAVWYFVGSAAFLGGFFDVVDGTPFEIAFLASAASFMYLSVVLRTRTLLFVGMVRVSSRPWSSGAYVGLLTLVGMRLRRVPPSTIVTARISAVKAGLQGVSVNDLEAHYLAGGNVVRVVNALTSADKANIGYPSSAPR